MNMTSSTLPSSSLLSQHTETEKVPYSPALSERWNPVQVECDKTRPPSASLTVTAEQSSSLVPNTASSLGEATPSSQAYGDILIRITEYISEDIPLYDQSPDPQLASLFTELHASWPTYPPIQVLTHDSLSLKSRT